MTLQLPLVRQSEPIRPHSSDTPYRPAWPEEHDDMLKALWPHVQRKDMTARQAANQLNALFGTTYTRSALLGRAFRLGMSEEKPKPVVRVSWLGPDTIRSTECPFPLWPHGETPTHHYCMKPVASGSRWCAEHRRICTAKPVAPSERARPKLTRMELRKLNGLEP